MEQSFSSHLASCDSCCTHCGYKLLQCLLHFPLNPDVDAVVFSHLTIAAAKIVLTLIYMALASKAIFPLAVPKVFQRAPLAGSSSLCLLWFCHIQHGGMQRSPCSRLSITCWTNYSQVITFQWCNYHCPTPTPHRFLSNCYRHIVSSIFHLVESRLSVSVPHVFGSTGSWCEEHKRKDKSSMHTGWGDEKSLDCTRPLFIHPLELDVSMDVRQPPQAEGLSLGLSRCAGGTDGRVDGSQHKQEGGSENRARTVVEVLSGKVSDQWVATWRS